MNIGLFKEKLREWSARAPWSSTGAGQGGECTSGEGKQGDRTDATSTSAAAVQSRVVQSNKEDLETHHGLVLQRFDSADWAMMQTKIKPKVPGDGAAQGGKESTPSRLSKAKATGTATGTERAIAHEPILKPDSNDPSAPNSSPPRQSPLRGK